MIDTSHRDDAICPHCGHVYEDSYEFFSFGQETAETHCHHCGKPFETIQIITITYTTKIIP